MDAQNRTGAGLDPPVGGSFGPGSWLPALLAMVLVAVLLGIVEFLVKFWHSLVLLAPGAVGEAPLLWMRVPYSADSAFMVIALAGGALGATLHAVASLTAHIAWRDFDARWTAWYLTNPVVGAALSVTLLLVLQAGLIGAVPVGGAAVQNPIGLAAAATLTGLFSRHALAKLKRVFDVAFDVGVTAPAGTAPRLDGVTPLPLPLSTATEVTVTGSGFDAGCVVEIGGRLLAPMSGDDTALVVALPDDVVTAPGDLEVRVRSGSGEYTEAIRVRAV